MANRFLRGCGEDLKRLVSFAQSAGWAVQQTRNLHLKFTKPGRQPVFTRWHTQRPPRLAQRQVAAEPGRQAGRGCRVLMLNGHDVRVCEARLRQARAQLAVPATFDMVEATQVVELYTSFGVVQVPLPAGEFHRGDGGSSRGAPLWGGAFRGDSRRRRLARRLGLAAKFRGANAPLFYCRNSDNKPNIWV